MHHNWQNKGMVASGGTVLQIAAGHHDTLWLVSPSGLFHRDEEGWRTFSRGIPFWRMNGMAVHGNNLWLSGQPEGIRRTTNGGRSWQRCWLDQANVPVMALTKSPKYSQDRTLLAGTDGDGILRSTDGGRHWELCNFGLREFAVLDLIAAPAVGRYEYVFAIAENGVYQSPNGGRAWRRVNSEQANMAPTALVVSPSFSDDSTVYLGNQAGDLLRSTDAGRQWQVIAEDLGPINALAFTRQGKLLIGGGAGIMHLEPSLGTMIETGDADLVSLPAPVLALTEVGDIWYAGLSDGLYVSEDDGHSWKADKGLAARRFFWYLTPSADVWLAGGPEEGAWLSVDGGHAWHQVWQEVPLLAMAATAESIWVSTLDGLFHSVDAGQHWEAISDLEEPAIALSVNGETIWAGTPSGRLWRLVDGDWSMATTPATGMQLLGLLSSGAAVIAATWSADTRTVDLWRSDDDGQSWQSWFSQPGKASMPQVALIGERGTGALVGLGPVLYRETNEGWQQLEMPGKQGNVTALMAEAGYAAVAFIDRVVSTDDYQSWVQAEPFCTGESIVALQRAEQGKIVAATATGRLFIA